MSNYIRIRPENIDKAAKIIAVFCAEKLASRGINIAPGMPLSSLASQSQGVPPIDVATATLQATNEPLNLEIDNELDNELETQLQAIDANLATVRRKLRGYRLLMQIHLETMEAFNELHRAEYEEYRMPDDKFIERTPDTENLITNARQVYNFPIESVEINKSEARRKSIELARLTYKD